MTRNNKSFDHLCYELMWDVAIRDVAMRDVAMWVVIMWDVVKVDRVIGDNGILGLGNNALVNIT